jgi:hypothetical protein
VFSNEAAVAAMRNIFANGKSSAADVAGDMVDISLRRGKYFSVHNIILLLL